MFPGLSSTIYRTGGKDDKGFMGVKNILTMICRIFLAISKIDIVKSFPESVPPFGHCKVGLD